MGKRSSAETLRLRAEKRAAHLEARRRDLRERYPNISHQAWSNLSDGLGGDGGKALRDWLATIHNLTLKCQAPIKKRIKK